MLELHGQSRESVFYFWGFISSELSFLDIAAVRNRIIVVSQRNLYCTEVEEEQSDRMTNDAINKTLQVSIRNVWINKLLLALVIVLICSMIMMPGASTTSRAVLVVAVTVLLVKAESRPQPFVVTALSIALSICTIIGLTKLPVSDLFGWLSVALIMPLVLSKWIFEGRGEPVSR